MGSKKRNIEDGPTLKHIAEALGVSPRWVSKLKDDGMPVHDIELATAWRDEQTSAGDIDEKIKIARHAKLVEEQKRVRLQNEEAMGQLVSRAECQEAWTRLGAAISKALQMAAKEIPRVCLGLGISKSLPKAKEKMAEIQTLLADSESEFWEEHKEKEDQ
jgi:phage terminase Nu1 subunit (DNA packaging protein)